MKWLFIGCNLSDVPKELKKENKMSIDDIKQLLENVPLKEGTIEADNVEELIEKLFKINIHPIKIKKANRKDRLLDKFKFINKELSKSKVEENAEKHVNKINDKIVPPGKFILFYKQFLFLFALIFILLSIGILMKCIFFTQKTTQMSYHIENR